MRAGYWVAACALLAASVQAQEVTPEAAAIVKGDPVAKPEILLLNALPKGAGARRALFNGRDLGGWEAWLGYKDPSVTFQQTNATPIGTSIDPAEVFSVVTEDGGPAIRAGGTYWGSLIFAEEFGDYHLSLEYKWGPKIWPPSEAATRNNGLLYHSFGPPGMVFGTWRKSVEFQLQHSSVGMVIPLGNEVRAKTRVGRDAALPYPHRVFRTRGRAVEVANGTPAWNVEHGVDAEKPVGEWNRIDLYVLGDKAIHVVNGVPVMVIDGLSVIGADGKRSPLTRGRIQLQSEGAETFFRNINIEPTEALPKVVAAK